MDTLYLVVPCYNEEEVLLETSSRLKTKLSQLIGERRISPESKVLFVNDGSKDKTWEIIQGLHYDDPIFYGLTLSRNRGHQNALLAGLMVAKKMADIVISLDADLQDDINAIDEFVEHYKNGSDIVYGVRSARKKDTFYKRTTAVAFYKLMDWLGVDTVFNHADYRLMSKRVLDNLENYGEVNLFLRGIVPLIGFESSMVYYERHERFAGTSKYPLRKMLAFAWDGITSFSTKPIKIITTMGFVISFFSVIALIYSFIIKALGEAITGWTSLTVSIWLIGGIQLLSIGVIGEYVGKIYNETKRRPKYIIEDQLVGIESHDEVTV